MGEELQRLLFAEFIISVWTEELRLFPVSTSVSSISFSQVQLSMRFFILVQCISKKKLTKKHLQLTTVMFRDNNNSVNVSFLQKDKISCVCQSNQLHPAVSLNSRYMFVACFFKCIFYCLFKCTILFSSEQDFNNSVYNSMGTHQ